MFDDLSEPRPANAVVSGSISIFGSGRRAARMGLASGFDMAPIIMDVLVVVPLIADGDLLLRRLDLAPAPVERLEQLRIGSRELSGIEIGHCHGGVSLSASARYVALLDGARRTLPVAFALAPDVHPVSRAPEEPNTAQLGARAKIELVPGGNLSLGYDARLGRHYKSHHGFLAFAANW